MLEIIGWAYMTGAFFYLFLVGMILSITQGDLGNYEINLPKLVLQVISWPVAITVMLYRLVKLFRGTL
jgi:uncharacterized membrane protein